MTNNETKGNVFLAKFSISPKDIVRYDSVQILIDLAPKGAAEYVLRASKLEERIVLEAVLRGKEVTQFELRRATNFSRSKLWRLLNSLEARELIKREKYGRTFKVKLAEWLE